MRAHAACTHLSVAAALAAALGACATPQENPFYKHSTAYQGPDARQSVQSVAYALPTPAPTSALTAEPVAAPDLYTRVAPTCPTAGACAPEGVAVGSHAPVVAAPWASPTEERFASGEGTPGFRAVTGEFDVAMPDTDSSTDGLAGGYMPPSASAEVVPDAPDTDISTLTISGPIVAAEALTGTRSRALMHRVEAGDTVYSLARRYCTTVGAVAAMNGLGADYAIGLGADLKLPANCN